ncbi:retrovirus-related Pol polyprotein from transposon opus [Trichonephila clavipes]|nr:retrovirus-related Pol polyprotein from transposon opus [Trichonephila clavipes]
MEAIPIPEITAEIVGRAFYEKWICRFGVPAKIVTDQGRQFEAELFRSIAALCGAKVAHTTSYHPQCNGKVECLHRTLKGAIKAHNNIRWTESLPTVLLGLRAAIRPDISYTIAQMVYGTSIKLPGEFFDTPTINMDPQNFVAKLQQHMAELKPLKSPSNRKQNIFVHKDLKSCSHVFLRIDRVTKALEPPYEGPYTVQKKIVGSSRHEKVPTRGKPGLKRPGRPRGEWIVRQALVDPTVTRSTIRKDVGVAIVPQTISRHLAEANLKSKRPFRALPLTPEHRQLRLQWCQARSMWCVTDWQKVVFSDESRFILGTDDSRVLVWRCPGPFLNGLPGSIFQQDNARSHTARVAQDFLRHFQTLPWPTRSPDLSPVVHVWDQLKRQMQ